MKSQKLYHIYPRGVRRGKLFESSKQHALFRRLFLKYARELCVVVVLLVPMTNHYHAIILCDAKTKSLFLKKANWAYAFAFNQHKKLSGHAFEKSGRCREIKGDNDLINVARYDYLNPVVAGMVLHPADDPNSTYASTVGLTEPIEGVDPTCLLRCFSEDDSKARRMLREFVECLTPTHPIVRAAGESWVKSHPRSAKARNCRWLVEFATLTSLTLQNSTLPLTEKLCLAPIELQLLAMKQISGVSERMMAAATGMKRERIRKMMARLRKFLDRNPDYQERTQLFLSKALGPKTV